MPAGAAAQRYFPSVRSPRYDVGNRLDATGPMSFAAMIGTGRVRYNGRERPFAGFCHASKPPVSLI